KELGITFRLGIRIAYVTTIRNRHSEIVDRALVSRNSISGPKFRLGSVCSCTPTAVPFDRTQIFVRPGIGTAREAPIQNRHFDPVGKRLHLEISGPALNSSLGAWSLAVDAIAYGHLFAQMGITFRSVIRITYKTTIRNRHSETPDAPLLPKISGPASNSSPGARSRVVDAIAYGHLFAQTSITYRSVIGITYKTTIWNRHSETPDDSFFPKAIRRHFGVQKPLFRTPKLRF
ncbi:hypothetical protein Taro_006201, partial [Colocasia esculenta]|nr:hypothetical protein [Colocasia esculenta]